MPLWHVMGQLYIYQYSNTLQAYNSNQTTTSEDICSDPWLPDLTLICVIFHSNSTKAFNVTHKMSVYFTAPLTPLNFLCTIRLITTILLRAACNSISTACTFSFSISKARLKSSTSTECGDVSSSVSCSWYNIWYSSFLLSSISFWYSCGSHVYENNSKMDFDGKRNGSKGQINLTENKDKFGLLCTRWRIFNKGRQCLSAGCLSMFHHTACQL